MAHKKSRRGLRATRAGFYRGGKRVKPPAGIFTRRSRSGAILYYSQEDGRRLTHVQATLRGRALLGAQTRAEPLKDARIRGIDRAARREGLRVRRFGRGYKITIPKRWSNDRAVAAMDAISGHRALRGFGIAPYARVLTMEHEGAPELRYEWELTWRVPLMPGEGAGAGQRMQVAYDVVARGAERHGRRSKLVKRSLIIYPDAKWAAGKVKRAERRKRERARKRARARGKRSK